MSALVPQNHIEKIAMCVIGIYSASKMYEKACLPPVIPQRATSAMVKLAFLETIMKPHATDCSKVRMIKDSFIPISSVYHGAKRIESPWLAARAM